MVDAARLADELRNEQEVAQAYERDRKLFECQVKDMQVRLDEAETNALKVSTRCFTHLYMYFIHNVNHCQIKCREERKPSTKWRPESES